VPLDGASLAGGAALRARDEAESAEAARLRKLCVHSLSLKLTGSNSALHQQGCCRRPQQQTRHQCAAPTACTLTSLPTFRSFPPRREESLFKAVRATRLAAERAPRRRALRHSVAPSACARAPPRRATHTGETMRWPASTRRFGGRLGAPTPRWRSRTRRRAPPRSTRRCSGSRRLGRGACRRRRCRLRLAASFPRADSLLTPVRRACPPSAACAQESLGARRVRVPGGGGRLPRLHAVRRRGLRRAGARVRALRR